jgi:hypothetical protein
MKIPSARSKRAGEWRKTLQWLKLAWKAGQETELRGGEVRPVRLLNGTTLLNHKLGGRSAESRKHGKWLDA